MPDVHPLGFNATSTRLRVVEAELFVVVWPTACSHILMYPLIEARLCSRLWNGTGTNAGYIDNNSGPDCEDILRLMGKPRHDAKMSDKGTSSHLVLMISRMTITFLSIGSDIQATETPFCLHSTHKLMSSPLKVALPYRDGSIGRCSPEKWC